MVLFFSLTLGLSAPAVQAHLKQVQINGDLEITYFSDPADPVANSQATLYIQVRNTTSNIQLPVLHFVVLIIPPTTSGPRVPLHPFSNSTIFTFDQPGNWILSFEIGLRNLAEFDTTAAFIADVDEGSPANALAAFASALTVAVPKSVERWGHIFAVVLWLGSVLQVANTYRVSSGSPEGLSNFAWIFRRMDIVVAVAVGLLILTGILRSFAHGLTTVDSLFSSSFGLVLFAKILLASGMITVGLFNRIYLLKKLDASISPSDGSSKKSKTLAHRMFYLTILEMGMGVSAILFGTVFTQIHTIT